MKEICNGLYGYSGGDGCTGHGSYGRDSYEGFGKRYD